MRTLHRAPGPRLGGEGSGAHDDQTNLTQDTQHDNDPRDPRRRRRIIIGTVAGAIGVGAAAVLIPLAANGGSVQHHGSEVGHTAAPTPGNTPATKPAATQGAEAQLTTRNWCSVLPADIANIAFGPGFAGVTCTAGKGSAEWNGQNADGSPMNIQIDTGQTDAGLGYYESQGVTITSFEAHGHQGKEFTFDGMAIAEVDLGSTELFAEAQSDTVSDLPNSAQPDLAALLSNTVPYLVTSN